MPDQYVSPTLSMRRTASVSDMLNCCVSHATASSTSNGISPLEYSRWRWFSAQNASPGVSAQAIGADARAMKLLSAAAVLRQVLIQVMSIPCSHSGGKPSASFSVSQVATQLNLSVTGGYFLPPV